jgi:PAS domain S-box-containing protein
LSIFHSSTGFIFFLDKDFNIISYNKLAKEVYSRLMHMELKEGRPIFQYMPPDAYESLKNTLNECRAGKIIHNEKKANFPNGPSVWVENTFVPVYDSKGKFLGISFQTINIDERKKTEEALIESEQKFSQMAGNIADGLWIGTRYEFLYINDAFENIWGIKKEELIKDPSLLERSIHPDDLDRLKKKHPERRSESEGTDEQYRIIRPDGEIRWIRARRFPVLDERKNVHRTAGIITDITERKKIEDALHLSEKRFKEMADTLPLLVYETDEKGNITYFNKAGLSYTGYTLDDFSKGLTLPMMFPPGEMERAVENANRTMSGVYVGSIEYLLKRKDGSLYPAIINTVPIVWEEKVIGRRGVVMDISELKKAEEKIKSSLKEKEVLLSEIHHRVKNNLQIISSILRLQSSTINDKRISDIFLDAQHRIITMGLVHEKLYKSDNFAKIDVMEYVSDLVRTITSSYSVTPEKLKVEYDIEPIFIHLDTMIPIGLILNELLTNSMKYAFPDGRKGVIHISLKKTEDLFKLSISDNGIGFPENFIIENSQSLGLRLVSTLCEQINGKLIYTNHSGSTFDIEFSELVKSQLP